MQGTDGRPPEAKLFCRHKLDRLGLTEKEKIEKEQFFELSNNGYVLRGHTMKLVDSRPRLDIRKYSFSQRVVAEWNRLPEHVVMAPYVKTFKNWLNKHWIDMGI